MNTALQRCQARHDDMLPPETQEPWIESEQGRRWLDGSIANLLMGRDVVIRYGNPNIEFTAAQFIARFGEEAVKIYAYDPESALEWWLVRGYRMGPDPYKALAREVAEKLLLPHAALVEEMHRTCPF